MSNFDAQCCWKPYADDVERSVVAALGIRRVCVYPHMDHALFEILGDSGGVDTQQRQSFVLCRLDDRLSSPKVLLAQTLLTYFIGRKDFEEKFGGLRPLFDYVAICEQLHVELSSIREEGLPIIVAVGRQVSVSDIEHLLDGAAGAIHQSIGSLKAVIPAGDTAGKMGSAEEVDLRSPRAIFWNCLIQRVRSLTERAERVAPLAGADWTEGQMRLVTACIQEVSNGSISRAERWLSSVFARSESNDTGPDQRTVALRLFELRFPSAFQAAMRNRSLKRVLRILCNEAMLPASARHHFEDLRPIRRLPQAALEILDRPADMEWIARIGTLLDFDSDSSGSVFCSSGDEHYPWAGTETVEMPKWRQRLEKVVKNATRTTETRFAESNPTSSGIRPNNEFLNCVHKIVTLVGGHEIDDYDASIKGLNAYSKLGELGLIRTASKIATIVSEGLDGLMSNIDRPVDAREAEDTLTQFFDLMWVARGFGYDCGERELGFLGYARRRLDTVKESHNLARKHIEDELTPLLKSSKEERVRSASVAFDKEFDTLFRRPGKKEAGLVDGASSNSRVSTAENGVAVLLPGLTASVLKKGFRKIFRAANKLDNGSNPDLPGTSFSRVLIEELEQQRAVLEEQYRELQSFEYLGGLLFHLINDRNSKATRFFQTYMEVLRVDRDWRSSARLVELEISWNIVSGRSAEAHARLGRYLKFPSLELKKVGLSAPALDLLLAIALEFDGHFEDARVRAKAALAATDRPSALPMRAFAWSVLLRCRIGGTRNPAGVPLFSASSVVLRTSERVVDTQAAENGGVLVFPSFAGNRRKVVHRIVNEVANRNHVVAPIDEQYQQSEQSASADIFPLLHSRLVSADIIVIFFSSAYFESQYCISEFYQALLRNLMNGVRIGWAVLPESVEAIRELSNGEREDESKALGFVKSLMNGAAIESTSANPHYGIDLMNRLEHAGEFLGVSNSLDGLDDELITRIGELCTLEE